jgi:hypothetical protein
MDRARRGLIWLAPFLIALAGYLVALRQMEPPFTADEPNYALQTFSVALDGDVDLANDYASIDRVRAATDGQTTSLQPQAYRWKPGGELVSMHQPGLPLLLAPAARISQTVRALQLEMVLLAAIAAQVLFSILAKVVPRRRWVHWASWAAVVFSLPLVGYSSRIYPELPGALLSLIVVRILLSDRLRIWQVLLASACIGLLPWFHVRFGLISVGLTLAVVLRLVELGRGQPRRALATGVVALVIPLVLSLGVMVAEFQHWYGTSSLTVQLRATDQVTRADPAPSADADAGATTPSPAVAPQISTLSRFVSAPEVLPGLFRSIYSSRNGWLPFMPVGLLAVAGAIALAVRARWWVALGGVVALAYAAQIASTGVLPAYALPGRYEIVFLPLLAVPLAMVLAQVRWTRFLFWPLAAIGAVLTLFGMTHAGGLVPFQSGTARADIGAANVLLRAWPTVSRETPEAAVPTLSIDLCDGTHPVAATRGCGDTGTVVARPGARAGVLWEGDRPMDPGDWAIAVPLQRAASEDVEAQRPAGRIEFTVDGRVVATDDIAVGEVPTDARRAFLQVLRLTGDGRLGVRVSTTGAAQLSMAPVAMRSNITVLTGLGTVPDRYPQLGWVLAWTAVLLALAAAITVSLRAGRT